MATTYFGGANGQSPILPPGSQDWSTVNPPEVQAQAWEFENARRAAERQREAEAMFVGRGQDLKSTTQAIEAATRLQGIRGYQADLAAGRSSQEALAKWAPMMFTKPTSAMIAPKPAAEVVEHEGMKFIQQPSGTLTRIPSVTAPEEASLQARLKSAERAYDTAQTKAFPATQMREQVTPGPSLTKIYDPRTWGTRGPAVTNQVPVMTDTLKRNELLAEQAGASNTVARLQQELADRRGVITAPSQVQTDDRLKHASVNARSGAEPKPLTRDLAMQFLREARGNKDEARKLAREAGYQL